MSREISLASPRLLSPESLSIFSKSHIKLEQHNLLHIKPLKNFQFDLSWLDDNVISVFTSIHALDSLERYFNHHNIRINKNKAIVIQGRTEKKAKKLGYDIIFASNSSRDFHKAEKININCKLIHFTTSYRLDTWKSHQRFKTCSINSVEVYSKELNFIKYNSFDAVMFFSPSQGEAFLNKNIIINQDIFCIGETTAEYFKVRGFKNIHISEKPSEKVMVKTITNYYNGK